MALRWTAGECELGAVLVAVSPQGLAAVRLADDRADLEAGFGAWAARVHPGLAVVRDDADPAGALPAVRAAIAGRPAADLPLDLAGTPFRRRVWSALLEIPRGEVRTYGEVARAVGAPRAVRAVGSACGANPVAVVVPCHRVVPAAGGVGAYAYGPDRKRRLLRREGASVADDDDAAARRDHHRSTRSTDR